MEVIMKYEVILFDVDDTLFDFDMSEKKALHKTFLEFKYPTGLVDYRDTYNDISKILWRDLELGTMSLSELAVERFTRLFHQHELDIDAEVFSRVYLENLGTETHPIEGAVEVCEKLKAYRLAIITNGFAAVQKARIENSELRNTFEQIIISEEVGYNKPAKKIFDYTFAKLQITDKKKVLIVGDSLTSDIQGGIDYGIDTCWFNPNNKENHIGNEPTFEINRLRELLKIVSK